jgi:hypothetical protein
VTPDAWERSHGGWPLKPYSPPDVAALDAFAGNASVSHLPGGFWERVVSLSVELVTDATVANRLVRVRYFAGEAAPFATVVAPFAVTASLTSAVSFAIGAQQAGAAGAASIAGGLPNLYLLPGMSLAVDVLAGVAGDAVGKVRLYRERFIMLTPAELSAQPPRRRGTADALALES